jgi:hypothetical protein
LGAFWYAGCGGLTYGGLTYGGLIYGGLTYRGLLLLEEDVWEEGYGEKKTCS